MGMNCLRSFAVVLGIAACLSSCGYDYDEQQVVLARGESFRGRTLVKVESDGVRLTRSADREAGSRFYSLEGRSHMGGSHSLGNNESVRIVSLDPRAQKAELEFSWLESVGPLTMPPF